MHSMGDTGFTYGAMPLGGAAATGNDRSPRVERRVDGTSSVDGLGRSEVLTCATVRDWRNCLSKVVRRSTSSQSSGVVWSNVFAESTRQCLCR